MVIGGYVWGWLYQFKGYENNRFKTNKGQKNLENYCWEGHSFPFWSFVSRGNLLPKTIWLSEVMFGDDYCECYAHMFIKILHSVIHKEKKVSKLQIPRKWVHTVSLYCILLKYVLLFFIEQTHLLQQDYFTTKINHNSYCAGKIHSTLSKEH